MAHVPPLTKHLFLLDFDGPCQVTREYQKVIKELFVSGTDPVCPGNLLRAFRKRFPAFANMRQHDTQEVILHLIDVFEASLGKEFVTDIFNGQEAQETICPDGTSTVQTSFTTMILNVTKECSLADLLAERSKPIGIENYTDDKGKTHHVAAVCTRVLTWPRVIGFSFSMYDDKFPIEIPNDFQGRRLFACVMHRGNARGGHYALLVRRYDKWYIKDDDVVTEVPQVEALKGDFYQAWYRS